VAPSLRRGRPGSSTRTLHEPTTPLERIVIVLVSLVVAIAAIAALSGFFAARDQAGVSSGTAGPGASFPDLGHAHLVPGQPHPRYNSDPPTTGAHLPDPVTRDGARLSNDQLLQALELGNVVIVYPGPNKPAGAAAFARSVAAPFSPTLGAAGQAVIFASRPRTVGLVGLAWGRMVRVSTVDAPLLKAFAQAWLGRGAPGR
jgi:hypothetical protein